MTPDEHYAKAEELAEFVADIRTAVEKATVEDGGLAPQIHAGTTAMMTAMATLAQVHATLATIRSENPR